jgi:FkbM family methyltransferase
MLILILKIFNLMFKVFKKNYFYQLIHDFLEENQYVSIKIDGKKVIFFCPSSHSLSRVNRFYEKEPDTLNWIDNFNTKNKIIFWDIGANLGLFSVYGAYKHSNIEIVSFEPSTSNTRCLSRNISINDLSEKIKLFQLALSNEENTISTFKETEFMEGSSISTFGEKYNYDGKYLPKKQILNQYKLFGTKIDYLIKNKILDVPNYIKIDVDGIEHLILEGGKELLKNKDLKEISIELDTMLTKENNQIIKLLEESGFHQKNKDKQGINNAIFKRNY